MTQLGSNMSLALADGRCWIFTAGDPDAAYVVQRLAEVMQLSCAHRGGRTLLVSVREASVVDQDDAPSARSIRGFYERVAAEYPWNADCQKLKTTLSCMIDPSKNTTLETLQLMQLSSLVALDVVNCGGVLLHGALIERDGMGVVLAGPGGVGKTTACNRVSEPWRALSDDATLVVRDSSGHYWAHPWPTWSRYLKEKVGVKWDVGNGVRLGGICFLSQSSKLDLMPLGEGEMVCLGMQSIEQAGMLFKQGLDKKSLRKLNHRYFRNMCQIAKTVPGFRLKLDLRSRFTTLIEDHFLRMGS
jgi:SynChlorMet cassette protein ScmC